MKYIIAILIFCAIIMFHEFGHFLLAKANGIRVNEFCLGLGPTIVGFQRGETKYSIKALPFGGACIMEGEDTASDDERSFNNKSPLARISVVAAGPVFNFIMAFALAVVILGCHGVMLPVINGTSENSAAEAAGMEAGDTIVSLNNKHIFFYEEISMYSIFHPGETVEVTYERDGEKYEVTLTPKYNEEYQRYLYGFTTEGVYTHVGPLKTLGYGVMETKYWIQYVFGSLKMLLTQQASLNDLSGPVGIVKMVGDTYTQSQADGAYYVFLNMMNIAVLLSANLGVMNLLPFPALDGGRLVFLVIELIRRKRIKEEREGMVHFIGLMCLLALMVLIMFNDVRKLIP